MSMEAQFEVAKDNEDKFYWLQVTCQNCKLSRSLAFSKRTTIGEHKCPRCECTKLVAD